MTVQDMAMDGSHILRQDAALGLTLSSQRAIVAFVAPAVSILLAPVQLWKASQGATTIRVTTLFWIKFVCVLCL
jgi:hypothetical protein